MKGGKNPQNNFEKNMKWMGLVACEANLATFLENACFSVHDNSFKTFLSKDFHTFLWCLDRLYEGCKGFYNKFFF